MQQNTPKLTIREGGFYRTRDGRRVGPMARGSGPAEFWVAPSRIEGRYAAWFKDGQYFPIGHEFHCTETEAFDLIAEWTDAAPAPAEGTLRELDVKPGDVCCHVESGHEYRFDGKPDSDGLYPVTRMNDPWGNGNKGQPDHIAPDSPNTFRLVSRATATDADAATLQRVMEASTPAVDLTALTSPFGLLPPETQDALKAHDGVVEFYSSRAGWVDVAGDPFWDCATAYRAAPQPKVETVTNREMYLTARGCIASNAKLDGAIPVRITYTTTNGVIDPASYRVEARG